MTDAEALTFAQAELRYEASNQNWNGGSGRWYEGQTIELFVFQCLRRDEERTAEEIDAVGQKVRALARELGDGNPIPDRETLKSWLWSIFSDLDEIARIQEDEREWNERLKPPEP